MQDRKTVAKGALSNRALNLLRCPSCKGSLMPSHPGLDCASCSTSYPVLNGVPILLDERNSIFRVSDISIEQQKPAAGRSWKKTVRRWLPRLEINFTGQDSILRFKKKLLEIEPRPMVLNIGGKHAGSFSVVVASGPEVECIEAHLAFTPRTNLITDPHSLPLADESIDAIIVDAVLEHAIDPSMVVAELYRVLKKDGLVYSDTPFMVQVHGGAFDFMRFSHLAHRRLFRRFSAIESGVSCGPGSALAVSIQSFLLSFVRSSNARVAIKGICCSTLFWLKYFDYLLINKPGSLDAALGTYFVGQKSTDTLCDRDLIGLYRGITPPLYVLPQVDGTPGTLTAMGRNFRERS